MSIFGKLIQATIQTVTIPIAVVKDVGAAMEGRRIDNTTDKVEEIKEKLSDAYEELGE